jgi:hypothetical protein
VTLTAAGCWLLAIQKFRPAVFAAKVEGLAVALGANSCRLVHFHLANWVNGHQLAFSLISFIFQLPLDFSYTTGFKKMGIGDGRF